jgi:hypothetical protein
MTYSDAGLVFIFSISISDYVTHYLHFVFDLHLNFIIWPQTSHTIDFKTNSLVNFHDSLSISVAHNKHYTTQLQIKDTAYIKAYAIGVTLRTQPQINGIISRTHATRYTHKPMMPTPMVSGVGFRMHYVVYCTSSIEFQISCHTLPALVLCSPHLPEKSGTY